MLDTIRIQNLDYLLMPKNTGLQKYAQNARNFLRIPTSTQVLERRGEDIPLTIAELCAKNKLVVGITGDDLFDEARYRYRQVGKSVRLINTIDWIDKKALYGRPCLALIARKDTNLTNVLSQSKIVMAIPDKYKRTSQLFVQNWLKRNIQAFAGKNAAPRVKFATYKGAVEENLAIGLADLAIDIVYSGRTIEENRLEIIETIRASDVFVIAGINVKRQRELL